METKAKKTIICRSCKKSFDPCRDRNNNIIKSRLCNSCLTKKTLAKLEEAKKAKHREIKEKLKTKSDWLRDLQKVFNKYIRLRDKNKPCISCNKPLVGKYDAGHFFTVGAYPNIRIHEDNVHGQCVECNQHKHGNTSEYGLNLPLRIGKERFANLLEARNKPLNISIPEIKEKISYYKDKIKQLESC